jgi:predicted nuclease with TOPRIM domain
MKQTYIDIMVQSLQRKLQVLDQIIEANIRQESILKDKKASLEAIDETVEEKAELIEQIQQLDSGFEKLFSRVEEELKGNKEDYAEAIQTMKSCIRAITDKSMNIQAQEARNKDLMVQRFTYVKDTAKSLRTNSKVATQYYKNMMNLNYVDPQFMDNKK